MIIKGFKVNPEFTDKNTGELKKNIILYVIDDNVTSGYGLVTKGITGDFKVVISKFGDIDLLKECIDQEKQVFISTQTYKYQEYLTDIFIPG